MIPLLGTVVFISGIAWFFHLDRDVGTLTSKALWIPVVWALLVSSRGVSGWFDSGPAWNLENEYTEGSPLEAAVYGILIGSGLVVLNFRMEKVRAFLRANTALVLFFSYCALSVLWSDYPLISMKRVIKGLGSLILVLVILTDPNPLAATRRTLSRGAFLLLPLSVLFIVCFPSLGTTYDKSAGVTYYIGVTSHKNDLGAMSMIFGLGSLWSFLGAYEDRSMGHRTRHMVAHGTMGATAACLLFASDSMTSIFCFLIAGAVMLITGRKWATTGIRRVSALFAGAFAIAAIAVFLDDAGWLLQLVGRSATLTGRTDIWKAVLSQGTNPLIGTGFDSFWTGHRMENVWSLIGYRGIHQAHNGFIEIYINLGCAGLALLGWAFWNGYREAAAAVCNNAHEGRLRLAILLVGLMSNLSEDGSRMTTPMWLFVLLTMISVPKLPANPVPERVTSLPFEDRVTAGRVRILQ